jgi:N-acetylmuramoyl-L-alanine amidase
MVKTDNEGCMTFLTGDSSRRRFLKQLATAISAGGFAPVILAVEQNFVHGLHVERHEDALRLVFDLNSTNKHKLYSLPNPQRLVLDLERTALVPGAKLDVKKIAPITRVRYAAQKDGGYRIVMDLQHPVDSRSFARISAYGPQLVVEVRPKNNVLAAAPADSSAEESDPSPVKSVDQILPSLRDIVIAIDAGHGGKDPGATGKQGTHEKDVVLQLARRLEELLQSESGYKPVLIRDGDYFMPLSDRVKKAREEQADLFVSLHADASPNRKAHGSSVYVLSENGASSEAARLLAAQENAVDLIGGISLEGKDELLASVLLDLSQRHTIESSQTIAGGLHAELSKLGLMHSSKVEQAAFAVLKSPDVPSVLVETAFISNPDDERRLRTKDYQIKITESIFDGIKGYFINHAPPDSFIAQADELEHTIRAGETLSAIAIHYRVRLTQLRRANSITGSNVRAGQVLKIPQRGI